MDRIISYILIAWLLFPPQLVLAQDGIKEYVPPSRAEFSELPDAKTAGKFVSDKMHETLSQGLSKAIKEIGEPLGRDIAPGGKISRRTIGKFDNVAIPNKLVAGDGMLSPAEGLSALMEESFFGDLNQKTWVPCNVF